MSTTHNTLASRHPDSGSKPSTLNMTTVHGDGKKLCKVPVIKYWRGGLFEKALRKWIPTIV
eukprot:14310400-Ditylum_brightwellii.AAC.1